MKKLSDKFSTKKQVIQADFKNVEYDVHDGKIVMYRDRIKIWEVTPIFVVGIDGTSEDFFANSEYAGAYDPINEEYCVRWPTEIQGVKGNVFFDPKSF